MLQLPRGHQITDTLHKEGQAQKVTATEAGFSQCCVQACSWKVGKSTPVLETPHIGKDAEHKHRHNPKLGMIVKQRPIKSVGEPAGVCHCHQCSKSHHAQTCPGQGPQLSYSCVEPSAEVLVLCFIRFHD